MQNSVEQKTTPQGSLFEYLATNRPWLMEELKKNQMLIFYASVVYAAEDALNLAFSYYSLGFAMNDAFNQHHDSASSAEFHDFEATPEGIGITVGFSLFLFAFSALGTYYADTDPEKLSLLMLAIRELWPYMRDMLKAIKWTYKGIRSTLLLVLMLSGEMALLYHILFPITIIFAILAAANRVAIRYMRYQRKKMMKDNELLAAEIRAQFHLLTVMKKLPEEDELPRFINSLIAVEQGGRSYEVFRVKRLEQEQDDPSQCRPNIKYVLEPIGYDLDLFSNITEKQPMKPWTLYIQKNQSGGLDYQFLDRNGKTESGQIEFNNQPDNEADFISAKDNYLQALLEQVSIASKITLPHFNKTKFTEELHQFQNETLCQQLSYLLPYENGRTLHFWPLAENVEASTHITSIQGSQKYNNSVIYFFDETKNHGKGVYVVDADGHAQFDENLSQRFEIGIKQIRKDGVLDGVPNGQLKRISALPVIYKRTFNNTHYSNWLKDRSNIDTKLKSQSKFLQMWCYVAVFFSALIDSLYFYMGVLFVASLSPHLFFAMLGMSCLLFVVCMLARIYEEYDYQRKLMRTVILATMAEYITEIRFIEFNLERLMVQLQSVKPSKLKETQNKIREQLAFLLVQVTKYQEQHQKREENLVLGFWSALVMGLTCGLGFQGVISALMFLVIAILMLTSTACPPALVFTFMSVGVACFLFSSIQFVVSYQHYYSKIKQQQSQLNQEEDDYFRAYLDDLKLKGILNDREDVSQWTWREAYEFLAKSTGSQNADRFEIQKNLLLNAKRRMDRCALEPVQKFDLLGWWEVLRLLISGIIKADKTYGEITLDVDHSHDESWVMFTVAIVFSILMGVMFALRALGKMFPVVNEKEKPSDTPLQTQSYPNHERVKSLLTEKSDDRNSKSGFFKQNSRKVSYNLGHSGDEIEPDDTEGRPYTPLSYFSNSRAPSTSPGVNESIYDAMNNI